MNRNGPTSSRLLLTIAFAILAMLLGVIGAVAAGTGTVSPPPKIAFVASNVTGSPDALTVGPMAGRLGAPLFITNKDTLGEATKDALVAYGADLIIVAGGPGSVTDAVLAQISTSTGLDIKPANTTPNAGIVRISGTGRDQTAVALSELIADYNPKFLPTDATAFDADALGGVPSSGYISWPVTTRAVSTGLHHNYTASAEISNSWGVDLLTPSSSTFSIPWLFNANPPPVPAGAKLNLTSITVCYQVDDPADSIFEIGISAASSNATASVSWNSTSKECAVATGSFPGDADEIYLYYDPTGTGAAHQLRIYTVDLAWERLG